MKGHCNVIITVGANQLYGDSLKLTGSFMAHLCYSIEMEPKTLNEGELNDARVAAVDIIQKMDPKKASDVFTEGLRPVISVKEMKEKTERRDQLHKLVKCEEFAQVTDCLCTLENIDESPDKAMFRETLSAPF
ncbi:PREDICTED: uncharacterized protein LOC104595110 [Nelumbo nucifera]|uniref:Uncharacterized protein LOC104595110 n=2 Tax=Nelumbo nucifera TaxID=4432 RepID=A0A1U7ZJ64_NELNU|nr:PREDICTED: uncharacterized protein LOC104595110 [Nelumbo nucifera]DAD26820.1 TPA_asm: hypothetical protein HUJ06_028288 [Nelumbo nucifera]